jgi:hypothetical protein
MGIVSCLSDEGDGLGVKARPNTKAEWSSIFFLSTRRNGFDWIVVVSRPIRQRRH